MSKGNKRWRGKWERCNSQVSLMRLHRLLSYQSRRSSVPRTTGENVKTNDNPLELVDRIHHHRTLVEEVDRRSLEVVLDNHLA